MYDTELAEQVYESLLGQLRPEYALDWVENMYAEGSECERAYADMLRAYTRLCERLGTGEEDADVEMIINSLLNIERILCLKMFEYGRICQQNTPHP